MTPLCNRQSVPCGLFPQSPVFKRFLQPRPQVVPRGGADCATVFGQMPHGRHTVRTVCKQADSACKAVRNLGGNRVFHLVDVLLGKGFRVHEQLRRVEDPVELRARYKPLQANRPMLPEFRENRFVLLGRVDIQRVVRPLFGVDRIERRADLILELQAGIMDDYNAACIGLDMTVLCEHRAKSGMCSGRTYADSPEIDGTVYFTGTARPGDMVTVHITGCDDGDLAGEQIHE